MDTAHHTADYEEINDLNASHASFTSSRGEVRASCVSRIVHKVTNNKKVALSMSLVLFATITSAQVVGALIAGSTALLADCASMGVDTISYAVNLIAECFPQPDKLKQQRNFLVTAGASYIALVGISIYFCVGAIEALVANEDDEEDPDANIIFAFAVTGILFDVISLVPYFFQLKGSEDASSQNLKSACTHVGADLLRSISTCIEGILLWTTSINGERLDAIVTLIVTATILIGVMHPIVMWFINLKQYLEDKEKHANGENDVESIRGGGGGGGGDEMRPTTPPPKESPKSASSTPPLQYQQAVIVDVDDASLQAVS